MKNETSEVNVDESEVGVIGKIVRIMGGIHIYRTSGHSLKTVFLFLVFLTAVMAGAGFFLLWEKEQPYFTLENVCLKSDASLIIRAGNEKANKEIPLDIEFGGFLFSEKGIPKDKILKNGKSVQEWHFALKECNPPEDLAKDGYHEIKIRFAGEDFCEKNTFRISFDTTPVRTYIAGFQDENNPAKRFFQGYAGKEYMSPENELNISIIYWHDGKEETTDIPLQRIDTLDGMYFRFEAEINVQTPPDPNDPRYKERFFEIVVKDKTGEKFSCAGTYESYMSPGDMGFGVNDLGRFLISKPPDKDSQHPVITVKFTPDPKIVSQLSDGEAPIIVTVKRELKARRLEWKNRVADVLPGTVIFRDGKEIATVSDTDHYIDREVLKEDKARYHVEKQGKDGTVYVSNTAAYINPEITNSINMKFVYIEPGTFLMGSPEKEPGKVADESPQHEVTLTQGFYMQTTEVTQRQWKAVMGSNPSYFKNCGDDCPVENVSWDDAQEFIKKLNQKEGKSEYRLPAEAEWEYAARAGTATPFAFGKCLSTDEANYDGNSPIAGCAKGIYREKTLPAGSLKANAWGLYDMHGNVWEWCRDWYGEYPAGSVTNPEGSSTGSRLPQPADHRPT